MRLETFLSFISIYEITPDWSLQLVDDHFTADFEMIFAVINLQFAVIDLLNVGLL